MYKYIIALIFFPVFLQAQESGVSTNQNFVLTTEYQNGFVIGQEQNATDQDKISNVSYSDGLGRPIQDIALRAGGQGQDVITHKEYDYAGRMNKDYLPFANSGTSGSFRSSAQSNTLSFYNTAKYENTTNPYTEKHFEPSPLKRIEEVGAPGNSWAVDQNSDADHTQKFVFETNTTNEVRYYWVTLNSARNPTLQLSGYYLSNRLTKTIVKDENWQSTAASYDKLKTVIEYKDKHDRVVLKRQHMVVGSSVSNTDTYYVYDEYGNLSFVLTPKSEPQGGKPNSTEISELCHQYKYDQRNRLVEKKLPGKAWEYIVYNKLDQPILSQDGNLRAQSKWNFTKFDAFNRAVYSGIYNYSASRTTMQNLANGSTNYFENRLSSPISINGVTCYYSNSAFPNASNLELLTINYYDSYVDLPSGVSSTTNAYGVTSTSFCDNLPTVNKVRILDTNNWQSNVSYYDAKGRLISIYDHNPLLNTIDVQKHQLDFRGNVLATTTTHKKTGQADIEIVDLFKYDHQERMVENKQFINEDEGELIACQQFDEIGKLTVKSIGGECAAMSSQFKDLTNLSVSGIYITKNTGNGWNGGLATQAEITNDGYVEFQAVQTNKYIMVGLSSDNTSASYNTIDHAMYTAGNGRVYVYESGSYKGYFGYYAAGDVFRVERAGTAIKYKRNGNVFYTSTVSSTGNLIGDISMHSSLGKIKNLHFSSQFKNYNAVNLIAENTFKKTGNGWNGNAFSTTKITHNGHLQFRPAQTNKAMMLGLSSVDGNNSYNTIKYAIYTTSSGRFYVYESGSYKGNFGYFALGDEFKVERVGSTIYYKRNNEIFYTSLTSSTGDLYGDVSMYHANGIVENVKVKNGGLQTVDYAYNVRDWLTDINDVNNLGDDLFSLKLEYDAPTSGQAVYNGNVSQAFWKTRNTDSSLKNYRYYYDELDRLRLANDNTGNYSISSIKYDKAGNITYLERKGHTNAAATTFGTMDRMYYYYNSYSNKLRRVNDYGNDNYGFVDGSNTSYEYTYDANGNAIKDLNKGITNIGYNHLNQPNQVTINGQSITNTYNAVGVKIRKVANGVTTDYSGNYNYENGDLKYFSHTEGYVEKDNTGSFVYVYQHKDHLGNVRMNFEDANADGSISTAEIREESNFYPFGLKHKGYNGTINGNEHRYKFSGKELNEEQGLDWYDYDARNYDAAIGRWLAIDPMSDVPHSVSMSPYNMVANNPVNNIDPDGLDWYRNNETGEVHWQEGNGEVEGYFHIGANYIHEGEDNFVVHYQNHVTAVIAKSDLSSSSQSAVMTAALATTVVLVADDATVIGVVDDIAIPIVLAAAITYDLNMRTYVTYNLTNPVTGQVYSGRSSGFGDPYTIMLSRYQYHHKRLEGFQLPTLDKAVQGPSGYPTIRGREQQLIDLYGRARSEGGVSGNNIRGVSKINPLGRVYHAASDLYFGPLYPYTGY